MEGKNGEQSFVSIRHRPCVNVSQLCLSFYLRGWTCLSTGPPALTYICVFPRLTQFTQPIATSSKRTVKNDCVLTHTVMTSTCALLLPFLSLSLLPPLRYLPLSFLPHSSSLLSPPFLSSHPPLSLFKNLISPFSYGRILAQFCGNFIAQEFMKITNCISQKTTHDLYLLFSSSTGEREEVHAPSGQPEGPRCGEEFHVQQAHILYFQYGVKVSS